MTQIHAHLTEALEAIREEADGLCFANCTKQSPCLACRVTEIAADALLGDGTRSGPHPIPPALRSGQIKAYMCNWCGAHLEADATITKRDLGPCPACKWEGNTKGWWPAYPRAFDLAPVVDVQTGGQL